MTDSSAPTAGTFGTASGRAPSATPGRQLRIGPEVLRDLDLRIGQRGVARVSAGFGTTVGGSAFRGARRWHSRSRAGSVPAPERPPASPGALVPEQRQSGTGAANGVAVGSVCGWDSILGGGSGFRGAGADSRSRRVQQPSARHLRHTVHRRADHRRGGVHGRCGVETGPGEHGRACESPSPHRPARTGHGRAAITTINANQHR